VRRRSRGIRALKLVLSLPLLTFALVPLAAALILFYQSVYAERIYPGVRVLELNLGGLSPAEALVLLEGSPNYHPEGRIPLSYGERVWLASLEELGAGLEVEATVGRAYEVGRRGGPLPELREQLAALRYGVVVSPVLRLEWNRTSLFVEQLAREIDRPSSEIEPTLRAFSAHLGPGQPGLKLDARRTLELLAERLATCSREEIPLPVEERPAAPSGLVELRVQEMLQGPLELVFEEQNWSYKDGQLRLVRMPRAWTLDRATIADMMLLHPFPSLDQKKLSTFVEDIARQIDQPPRQARFSFETGSKRLVPIVTSQEGRRLDITQTISLVNSHIISSSRLISLPVHLERPKVAMEEVGRMGIVELVSEGKSEFKGSTPGRQRNIELGAARLHGLVIPPGEVFSFLEHLGPTLEALGYEDSYIIFRDRTELGPGGGICQVSTTIFRAAFFGGFPILERTPHSYRVGWYEPPVGLDATVFEPIVDFKFKNDLSSHLLIQTQVNTRTGSLIFRFYGTKPDRSVEMEGPVVENVTPPGPPIYEEDPALPKGAKELAETAHDGADVTIYRIIKRGGRVVAREKFVSKYKPWPARYKVALGEKPTPTPTPNSR